MTRCYFLRPDFDALLRHIGPLSELEVLEIR